MILEKSRREIADANGGIDIEYVNAKAMNS